MKINKKFWLTFWQQVHFLSRESNSSQILVVRVWMVIMRADESLCLCITQLSPGKSSQIWSTIYLCTSLICILSSIYQDVLCSLSSIPNEIVVFLVFKAGTCSNYFLYFAVCNLISLSYFVLPKLHWIKLNKKSVTPWHYKQNYNIFKQHWPICSLEKFIWTVSILHSWCQCNDTPLVLLLAFAILFYWKTLW